MKSFFPHSLALAKVHLPPILNEDPNYFLMKVLNLKNQGRIQYNPNSSRTKSCALCIKGDISTSSWIKGIT